MKPITMKKLELPAPFKCHEYDCYWELYEYDDLSSWAGLKVEQFRFHIFQTPIVQNQDVLPMITRAYGIIQHDKPLFYAYLHTSSKIIEAYNEKVIEAYGYLEVFEAITAGVEKLLLKGTCK